MSEYPSYNPEEDKAEKYKEVTSISFSDLKRGSKFRVYTGSRPEDAENKDEPDYEITVIGIRKNGLQVLIKAADNRPRVRMPDGSIALAEPLLVKARMPGGYVANESKRRGPDVKTGITPGIIKLATEEEDNCLFFENLRWAEDNEPIATSSRPQTNRRILLKED